ncbi:MAG: NUDIX hydrolase [Burkholderiaceae bacterium]|nr:NUDIX hydrolase [Burkholderiaceae bacterium]
MDKSAEFFFPAPRLSNYCSQCGTKITRRVPPGDNRGRDLCEQCGAIHYQNPRVVVGTLPVWDNKVLLCLRAIEPRANTWTLPAGFMELAETTGQGALRETREEAGVEVELGSLYTVIDVSTVDQIHVYFLAHAQNGQVNPGPESLDARYFALNEIPWENLSFRSVSTTLKHYISDLARGQFETRYYSLPPSY